MTHSFPLALLDVSVDSKEGMEVLAEFARAHGFVLNEWHEQMAAKHGVAMDGVNIARALPASRPPASTPAHSCRVWPSIQR